MAGKVLLGSRHCLLAGSSCLGCPVSCLLSFLHMLSGTSQLRLQLQHASEVCNVLQHKSSVAAEFSHNLQAESVPHSASARSEAIASLPQANHVCQQSSSPFLHALRMLSGVPNQGHVSTRADLPSLLGSFLLLSQQVPLRGSHAPATLLLSHLGLPGSNLGPHLLPTEYFDEEL